MKFDKSKIQLILVLFISVLTASSIYIYVSGVENRVRSEQELFPTLIVSRQIPVGLALEEAFTSGYIQVRNIPRNSLPSFAITQVDQNNGKLVALKELQPGQFLTESNFGKKATNTSALQIPQGLLAITLTIGEAEKVATFLQPGSEVAIFGTSDTTGTGEKSKVTKVLFPRIQILAIGNQIVPTNSNSAPSTSSGLITVAVTPTQAEKLINASQSLKLYFALRSDGVDFSQVAPITDPQITTPKK